MVAVPVDCCSAVIFGAAVIAAVVIAAVIFGAVVIAAVDCCRGYKRPKLYSAAILALL